METNKNDTDGQSDGASDKIYNRIRSSWKGVLCILVCIGIGYAFLQPGSRLGTSLKKIWEDYTQWNDRAIAENPEEFLRWAGEALDITIKEVEVSKHTARAKIHEISEELDSLRIKGKAKKVMIERLLEIDKYPESTDFPQKIGPHRIQDVFAVSNLAVKYDREWRHCEEQIAQCEDLLRRLNSQENALDQASWEANMRRTDIDLAKILVNTGELTGDQLTKSSSHMKSIMGHVGAFLQSSEESMDLSDTLVTDADLDSVKARHGFAAEAEGGFVKEADGNNTSPTSE